MFQTAEDLSTMPNGVIFTGPKCLGDETPALMRQGHNYWTGTYRQVNAVRQAWPGNDAQRHVGCKAAFRAWNALVADAMPRAVNAMFAGGCDSNA